VPRSRANGEARGTGSKGIGILRSALICVSGVALLLAGVARTGTAIGLWDPVQGPRSVNRVTAQMLHSSDAHAASLAATESRRPNPNPPVSARWALLVALASAALALLLTVGSRFVRRLSELPYSLRPGPPRGSLRQAGFRGLASPGVLGRTVRSRPREASAGSVRLWSKSILRESSESLVMFVLSVVVGVGLGILVALYAG
jgi:hypothetical protein